MSTVHRSRVAQARPVSRPSPVVLRGNFEISSVAELKQIEKATHIIGNVTIDIPGKVRLPRLQQVEGDLNLGGEEEIALKNLQSVSGSVTVAGSDTLRRILLPKLETIGANASISTASYPISNLEALDLRSLERVVHFSTALSGLRTLSLPRLAQAATVSIQDNPRMSRIELPRLKKVDYQVSIRGNPVPAAALESLRARLVSDGVEPAKLFISP